MGCLAWRHIPQLAHVLCIAMFLNQIVGGIHILLLPRHMERHTKVGNNLRRVSVALLVPIRVAIQTLG